MNPFNNRFFLFCSLILYCLLLTVALLYFRFPAETFKHFCQTKMEQLLPGTRCSIEAVHYRFPLAIELEQMHFSSKQKKGQELGTIDRTVIQPQLPTPKSHFQVETTACDGNHSFFLVVDAEKQEFTMEDIQLENLNLAKLPFLQETLSREINGSLSGNGSYQGSWQKNRPPAKGRGEMIISAGSFSLLFPIFSLNEIDLTKMTTDLVLEKNKLKITKGSFHGKQLKGNFSGDLGLKTPLKQSQLVFKGKLEPLPPLLKTSKYARDMISQLKKQQAQPTFPFQLTGKVESPKFKIGS